MVFTKIAQIDCNICCVSKSNGIYHIEFNLLDDKITLHKKFKTITINLNDLLKKFLKINELKISMKIT